MSATDTVTVPITPANKVNASAARFKDFLAGCCGGVAQTLVGQPFDTIKVRLQTQQIDPKTGKLPFSGPIDCVTTTVKNEGFRGLYKGMSSPLVGAGIANAFIFSCYGFTRQTVLKKEDRAGGNRSSDTLLEVFVCGAGAGVGAALINCPMELVRTRLQVQTQGKENALYKGPIDCIRKMWKADGLRGPLKGMMVTIYRDIPGFAIYFTSYEWARRALAPKGGTDLSMGRQLLAGGFGGMVLWLLTYPVDVIKSRIQTQPDGQRIYKTTWDCAVQSYRKEGWRVFVRGLETTLLRAFPVNASVFAVYELTRKFLN